jgi:hypothetical protein
MAISNVAQAHLLPQAEAAPLERPDFKRFFNKLPQDFRESLDQRQREAMARALIPDRSPHWIDLKASMPIPGFGIYVALMVGREQRRRERLIAEGQLGLGRNLAVAAIFVSIIMASASVAVLLLKALKTTAGIDGEVWRHLIHPGL